jgi:hypothetical protein
MRSASTVGFAVEEGDRERLDHLAWVFGGGNRSAFLRSAMRVMEQLELAQELARTQAYGAQRLAEARYAIEDIPDIVARALAEPDPDAIAQAKLIVADLARRSRVVRREPPGDEAELRAAVAAALAETAES